MGLAHSPRIVMNGLTLLLDAANVKSYPGSGSNWYDLSQYKNHVTLNNTTFDTKDNNKAIYFNGTNAYGSGRVSFVRYYNRVLSDPEILQNFNALRGRFGI